MAVIKQRLNYKTGESTYKTVHLETSSDIVIRPDGSTVEQTLKNINNHASSHSSSGTDPITPASIGAFSENDTIDAITNAIAKHEADLNHFIIINKKHTNHLINWYFINPINQRKAAGIISNPGYFIDRWKLVDGEVTIHDDGLYLNGTIIQILENKLQGEKFTASYLTDNDIRVADYDNDTKTFSITAKNTLIKATKLETGTTQTLANNETGEWLIIDDLPDIVQELLKCQRYYVKFNNMIAVTGSVTGSALCYRMDIPLSTPLRVAPAVNLYSYSADIHSGHNKHVTTNYFEWGWVKPTNIYTYTWSETTTHIVIDDQVKTAVDTNNSTMTFWLNGLSLDAEL